MKLTARIGAGVAALALAVLAAGLILGYMPAHIQRTGDDYATLESYSCGSVLGHPPQARWIADDNLLSGEDGASEHNPSTACPDALSNRTYMTHVLIGLGATLLGACFVLLVALTMPKQNATSLRGLQ